MKELTRGKPYPAAFSLIASRRSLPSLARMLCGSNVRATRQPAGIQPKIPVYWSGFFEDKS